MNTCQASWSLQWSDGRTEEGSCDRPGHWVPCDSHSFHGYVLCDQHERGEVTVFQNSGGTLDVSGHLHLGSERLADVPWPQLTLGV